MTGTVLLIVLPAKLVDAGVDSACLALRIQSDWEYVLCLMDPRGSGDPARWLQGSSLTRLGPIDPRLGS